MKGKLFVHESDGKVKLEVGLLWKWVDISWNKENEAYFEKYIVHLQANTFEWFVFNFGVIRNLNCPVTDFL